MKNRKKILLKLSGLIITSQILPVTYTIISNAQTPSDTNVLIKYQTQDSQNMQVVSENPVQNSDDIQSQIESKNKLSETKITLAGVGCQEGTHRFELTFNTNTNKLKVTILNGVGDGKTHPFHPYFKDEYINIQLLDSYGNIKNKLSLKGTDNVTLVNELNNWDFKYGDRLRIKHYEADWRTKIDGNVTNPEGKKVDLHERTSKDELNKYDFKITKSGLQEVPAFTNEIDNNKITFSGVGCQEGTHKFELKFDTQNNKLKVDGLLGVGYTGTHPFHPSFNKEYIKIELLDSDGKIKERFSMKGTDNVKKAEKLNEWSFKYGDSLRIYHAQVAQTGWRVKIDGIVYKDSGEIVHLDKGTSQAEFDKYDFQITKEGLKEIEKKVTQVSNLMN